MDIVSFKNRQFSDDLEVKTLDDQILYINRNWLCLHSNFFKSLLTNGCAETFSNHIKLSHECIVLETVFGWLCYAYRGETYIKQLLNKIATVDLLYDLFSTFEEYNLIHCKEYADNFFSGDDITKVLLNNTECIHTLIEIVVTFKLNKMRIKYNDDLDKRQPWIIPIIKNVNIEQVDVFSDSWGVFTMCFLEWAIGRDPSDDELRPILNDTYDNAPPRIAEQLIRCIRNFTKAEKFKAKVLGQLSYVTFPKKK